MYTEISGGAETLAVSETFVTLRQGDNQAISRLGLKRRPGQSMRKAVDFGFKCLPFFA